MLGVNSQIQGRGVPKEIRQSDREYYPGSGELDSDIVLLLMKRFSLNLNGEIWAVDRRQCCRASHSRFVGSLLDELETCNSQSPRSIDGARQSSTCAVYRLDNQRSIQRIVRGQPNDGIYIRKDVGV